MIDTSMYVKYECLILVLNDRSRNRSTTDLLEGMHRKLRGPSDVLNILTSILAPSKSNAFVQSAISLASH